MGLDVPGHFIPDIFAADSSETSSLFFTNPDSEF